MRAAPLSISISGFGKVTDDMDAVLEISPRDPQSAREPGEGIEPVTITK